MQKTYGETGEYQYIHMEEMDTEKQESKYEINGKNNMKVNMEPMDIEGQESKHGKYGYTTKQESKHREYGYIKTGK